MIEYQLSYFRGAGQPIVDASVVLFHDNRPCALWPLSIVANSSIRLGSNGTAILPPLFARDVAPRSRKSITSACLDALDAFRAAAVTESWTSVESFDNSVGLSEWHDFIMQRGGSATVRHDLYVDLSLDIAAIKSNFRKSYKSLVTSGRRLWSVDVLREARADVWDEFRALHISVAGRVTRSVESWDRQFEAIVNGDAFLVYLRDETGRFVGGGLFHTTRDEGLYAVAAYDRSLFDKPLGHVVQFQAIEEMKTKGLRWYKLGMRCYASDTPTPTTKELSIAEFKQGFATHLFASIELRCGAGPVA